MFTIASLNDLKHNNNNDVLNAARDAIACLQLSGFLGQNGGFLIS